jgi:hypothetical protein
MFDSVVRFFTCGLTGDECAIILRNGEEICVMANEMRGRFGYTG